MFSLLFPISGVVETFEAYSLAAALEYAEHQCVGDWELHHGSKPNGDETLRYWNMDGQTYKL